MYNAVYEEVIENEYFFTSICLIWEAAHWRNNTTD